MAFEQSVMDGLNWVHNHTSLAEAAYKDGQLDQFAEEANEARDELEKAIALAIPDGMPLIEMLTKKVTQYFAGDPSAPSIITAWIDKKGQWYTSVARYHERLGAGKEVVAKAMDQDLQCCYKQLNIEFDKYRQLVVDSLKIAENEKNAIEKA